jgi:hypothetical protein
METVGCLVGDEDVQIVRLSEALQGKKGSGFATKRRGPAVGSEQAHHNHKLEVALRHIEDLGTVGYSTFDSMLHVVNNLLQLWDNLGELAQRFV